MSTSQSKDALRRNLSKEVGVFDLTLRGRLAENLRRTDLYRSVGTIFVSPGQILDQVRINALGDGKKLVMPAPGLKEGFYILEPYQVPFKKIPVAVTYKGLSRFGHRLSSSELSGLDIGLLVSEVIAVSYQGNFLADGKGLFDLAGAILKETGALAENLSVMAVIDNISRIVDEFPAEKTDIICGWLLGPGGEQELPCDSAVPLINWESLPGSRIKRITPLWEMVRRRNQGA